MFDRLPQAETETGRSIGSNGSLGTLRRLGGGEMRFKDQSHLRVQCDTTDYIEKVNYNGHAIRNYMNKEIEERMFQQDFALNGTNTTLYEFWDSLSKLSLCTHISPK